MTTRSLPAAILLLGAALALVSSATVVARAASEQPRARVVLVIEQVGCREAFERLVCGGFKRALRVTDLSGRIVTTAPRQDYVETLELIASQRYDLVTVFGFGYYRALGVAAKRQPAARFAIMDAPRKSVTGAPSNVQGIVFRTSEAAYLAGWLAVRMAGRRPGKDVVGIVGGLKIPSVQDFVMGFRAGARRGSPRARVLVGYSNEFDDPTKCEALARRQIAQGAEVVFNVGGACGLGTLAAARKAGVWGIGVDTDQSFLGPHILTSVLKHYDAGFVSLLRRVKSGRIRTGGDTVLTLREGAVGLGKISRRVPAPLRAELERLERRITSGALRVPGAYPDPR